MSPITHGLISWSVANTSRLGRKDRTIVTIAGVLPDLDGAGLIFDFFSRNSPQQLDLWSKYHHVLCHNIGFYIIIAIAAYLLSDRRWTTSILVGICFHLHLLCDFIGSRGPDGYQWPIQYFLPFSDSWPLTWVHQWPLNAWPNIFITILALSVTFYLAWKRGVSPLEIVSCRANRVFVDVIRKRFGRPEKKHANGF